MGLNPSPVPASARKMSGAGASASVSNELHTMKRRRQCSLEWEVRTIPIIIIIKCFFLVYCNAFGSRVSNYFYGDGDYCNGRDYGYRYCHPGRQIKLFLFFSMNINEYTTFRLIMRN